MEKDNWHISSKVVPEEAAHLPIKAYKSITGSKQEATQTCESRGF